MFPQCQNGVSRDRKLHMVFCDVGQGDAIYIRTPGGADILIDGGRGTAVLSCLSRYMPLWDRELELVFATHPDADHIGGLVEVLKSYRIKTFGTIDEEKDTGVYRDMMSLIKSRGIEFKLLDAGDNFSLTDGVHIKTYWPDANYEDVDSNDHSLVQVLTFKDFDLLLTGDISYQILNTLPIDASDIEVFKLPHHGSKTGIDATTLGKIDAEMAIISVGAGNSYHHPHPSVVALLSRFKMPYLRTDQIGDIEVVSDGQEMRIVK